MNARIAYCRTSTPDQSVEAQLVAMRGTFDKVFKDEGISGAVPAAHRPGFAALMAYAREGDTVCVYAVDRLGRDAIDVQQTVRALLTKGVTVDVLGLGPIGKGVGELILAVLAQVAQMERDRINERTRQGRAVAKELLASTGKTQHGATSMGRPVEVDLVAVKTWRDTNSASIAKTAAHFGISESSVKRACRA